jgi:hypothetical protein
VETKAIQVNRSCWMSPLQYLAHKRALEVPHFSKRVRQNRMGWVVSETMVCQRDRLEEWISQLRTLGRQV